MMQPQAIDQDAGRERIVAVDGGFGELEPAAADAEGLAFSARL